MQRKLEEFLLSDAHHTACIEATPQFQAVKASIEEAGDGDFDTPQAVAKVLCEKYGYETDLDEAHPNNMTVHLKCCVFIQ